MIDHCSLVVRDLERSKLFYEKTLAPLGYRLAFDLPQAVSFAEEGKTAAGDFWLSQGESSASHLAFRAESHAQVEEFYAAGLAAGARDNGAPGVRPHYQQPYYAAFLLDPDGHNIEAVCRSLED